MAILKRRDRLVVFRLSQDEYDGLRAACAEQGAASISAFARSELMKSLNRESLSRVSGQLSKLQSSIHHITQILETFAKEPK